MCMYMCIYSVWGIKLFHGVVEAKLVCNTKLYVHGPVCLRVDNITHYMAHRAGLIPRVSLITTGSQ